MWQFEEGRGWREGLGGLEVGMAEASALVLSTEHRPLADGPWAERV